MTTKQSGKKAAAPKRVAKKKAAPTATQRSSKVGVEALAAETAAYGKREDRQLGNTNYNRPFQSDRHAGATYGPPSQNYYGSTGPTLAPSVAVKVLTLTIGAGTITPTPTGFSVGYLVDWGDGLTDTYTSAGAKTHTYAAAGTWQVTCTQTITAAGDTSDGYGQNSKTVQAVTT
jgi:hypothetical protein